MPEKIGPDHKVPRSTPAAVAMLERFAAIESAIGAIEAHRSDGIAHANAVADSALEPLVAERAELRAKLRPWWERAGAALTKGARKTIELGGCVIGTKAGRTSLAVEGHEDDVVIALRLTRWGQRMVRSRFSLDRRVALNELAGVHGDKLRALGLSVDEGAEEFVLKRAEQAGTIGAAA